MFELKLRGGTKPFCPVHHWRMAHDAGSNKVTPSYRCSYESCAVRYTATEGYFESGKTSGDQTFLSGLETVACKYNHEHHPRIIGYAKESNGDRTEEWRHWQCFEANCDFAHRQKLPALHRGGIASHRLVSKPVTQLQHAFSKR
jgi:hypothetical protein